MIKFAKFIFLSIVICGLILGYIFFILNLPAAFYASDKTLSYFLATEHNAWIPTPLVNSIILMFLIQSIKAFEYSFSKVFEDMSEKTLNTFIYLTGCHYALMFFMLYLSEYVKHRI